MNHDDERTPSPLPTLPCGHTPKKLGPCEVCGTEATVVAPAFGEVCQHSVLARTCDTCRLESELERAEARLKRAVVLLRSYSSCHITDCDSWRELSDNHSHQCDCGAEEVRTFLAEIEGT